MRARLSPVQWRSLTEHDRLDLIAWHVHTDRELARFLESLAEQKANSPEVVTQIVKARLGL